MQPNPDYEGADKFIKNYGDELGLKKGDLFGTIIKF